MAETPNVWAFAILALVNLVFIVRANVLEDRLRRERWVRKRLEMELDRFGVSVTVDPNATGITGIYFRQRREVTSGDEV